MIIPPILTEMFVITLGVAILDYPATVLHELGHKIAMNYFGYGAKIHIGWNVSYCEYVTDKEYILKSHDRIVTYSGGVFAGLVLLICYLFYPATCLLVSAILDFVYAFFEGSGFISPSQ